MAREPKPTRNVPWLERAAGLVGLLLTLAMLGLLVRHAIRDDDAPPAVTVAAERILALPGGGYVVEFTARNRARTATAAQLMVEGELRTPAGTETAEATLDYVPARSGKRGGLHFVNDPRSGRLELRAVGYSEP